MISIVFPVYNQAEHIAAALADISAALVRVPSPYELIVVVNGSKDESFEVCRKAAAGRPEIVVLKRDAPGWGGAVKEGLAVARGDILCYTNSARTGGPDLVLMLLYALAYPGVVVKANRKIRDSAWRRIGSVLFNLECRALFDLVTWDINGTPKVFPRSLGKLLELTRVDDLIDVEFCVTCRREEYPVVEVPVMSTTRRSGRSTTTLRTAAHLFWRAWRMARAGP